MFVRFKLPDGEININSAQVREFQPGEEAGTSVLTFTDGAICTIPFSNQSVRHAFKKALSPEPATEG